MMAVILAAGMVKTDGPSQDILTYQINHNSEKCITV